MDYNNRDTIIVIVSSQTFDMLTKIVVSNMKLNFVYTSFMTAYALVYNTAYLFFLQIHHSDFYNI